MAYYTQISWNRKSWCLQPWNMWWTNVLQICLCNSTCTCTCNM